jgi:hypothetical protein
MGQIGDRGLGKWHKSRSNARRIVRRAKAVHKAGRAVTAREAIGPAETAASGAVSAATGEIVVTAAAIAAVPKVRPKSSLKN